MKRSIEIIIILALAAGLAACAARAPKQVASQICIKVERMERFEEEYLQKRIDLKLREEGFVPASTGCEVSVNFVKFGQFQGEGNPFAIAAKSGYWSMEGVANVSHNGRLVIEDKAINRRAYPTKQELLNDLADDLVDLVESRFQRAPK